jgi:hypothetical protein
MRQQEAGEQLLVAPRSKAESAAALRRLRAFCVLCYMSCFICHCHLTITIAITIRSSFIPNQRFYKELGLNARGFGFGAWGGPVLSIRYGSPLAARSAQTCLMYRHDVWDNVWCCCVFYGRNRSPSSRSSRSSRSFACLLALASI